MQDHTTISRAWAAFDSVGPETLAMLRELAEERTFGLGERLFQEGRETPFLGAIDHGRVAIRLRTPELGHRLSLATIEPAELLGWSALVPPFRSTADAVATEPVRLVAFDGAALRERIASDRLIAGELLPVVLETVAHRLTTSWHQLLDLFEPRARGPW